MFVKFINKDLGNFMLVHESRVDEYKAAGHKPAAKSRRKTTKSTAKKEEK